MNRKLVLQMPGFNGEASPILEAFQELTIEEGSIDFVSYDRDHLEKRRKHIDMDTSHLFEMLLGMVSTYQSNPSSYASWTCTYYENDKEVVSCVGPMNGQVTYHDLNMTEYLRSQLPIVRLFGFDNTDRTDVAMCYCAE